MYLELSTSSPTVSLLHCTSVFPMNFQVTMLTPNENRPEFRAVYAAFAARGHSGLLLWSMAPFYTH